MKENDKDMKKNNGSWAGQKDIESFDI